MICNKQISVSKNREGKKREKEKQFEVNKFAIKITLQEKPNQ